MREDLVDGKDKCYGRALFWQDFLSATQTATHASNVNCSLLDMFTHSSMETMIGTANDEHLLLANARSYQIG